MSFELNPAKTTSSDIVIGIVGNVTGSSATCRINATALKQLQTSPEKVFRMAGLVGSQVKISLDDIWLIADIREVKRFVDEKGDWIVAEIDFLGEGDKLENGNLKNFRRAVSYYPRPGSNVYAVTQDDLRHAFAADDRFHIEIGTIHPTLDVRAPLCVDAMLGKHFAILGSTGTGKSTLLALMLHKIVERSPHGHIVVIDPHGEYATSFKDTGEIFNIETLKLPYWVMNFEEHCEVLIKNDGRDAEQEKDVLRTCLLLARSRNNLAQSVKNLSVDTPVPYSMNDLLSVISDQMGKLDNKSAATHYIRLKIKIEELTNDPRYSFMFDRTLFFETLENIISTLLRMPAKGKPISIIDLSRIPSELINVVVAVLSRLIFDFAIWSRAEEPKPILLICEEAQRYLPSDRVNTNAASRRILERIAKEGRKYGVSLGLVSQRPSDLSESALSQCGTMLAMRLNNDRDQAVLRSTMPEVGRSFVEAIQALRNRECIICGEGVTIPIRVRIDEIDAKYKPSSENPIFSELWNKSTEETEAINRTTHRWINQEF
ncbi:MAG TPA: ATPase [Legionellales bacterium]|nr:ATPase [Legionellales bacterium]